MTPDTEQDSKLILNHQQSKPLQQFPADDDVELSNPPQGGGFNLRPLLRTAQRNVLLIAGITSIVTVAAAFAGMNSASTYSGSFQLLIEPVTSEDRLAEPTALARGQGQNVPDDKFFEVDYSTIFKILTGPGMLTDIAEQVQEQNSNFLPFEDGELAVERLTTDEFGDTKIIEVTYQDTDPELVELVLEATAQRYLKYSLDERKTRIGQGVEFIEDQLPQLQERVNSLQGELQALQQQYELIDPETTGEELFANIRDIETQQLEAQRELTELRTLYTSLQQQLELNPDEALAASALSEDPSYQTLLEKLKDVESQIAIESARFEPTHPTLQGLVEQRQNLQRLLEQETQRVLGQNLTNATASPTVLAFQNSIRQDLIAEMVDTANQIQVLAARTSALESTKNALAQQARQFPAVAGQYNDIQRQLDLTTRTLDQLLNQRETLRVEAAQSEVPWELVAEPELIVDIDGEPLPEAGKPLAAAGVVAGLLLGLGAAVLLEKLRDIFYDTTDIEEATKLPILAEIPIDETGGTLGSSPLFLDAFESLYANIRFRFSAPSIRSLTVCSAASSDGKSTVALHLAKTVAAMGQRVLLVDANLRSPELHSRLNLPNYEGLNELLNDKVSSSNLIEQSHFNENLVVLTAGQIQAESSKLLASPKMQQLMEKFHSRFDLVIYDTPNLLDYTDANFLAANTDGLLLVVAIRDTKQSLVNRAIEQIKTFNLPTLGVVVNQVKPSSVASSRVQRTSYEKTESYEQVG